MTELAPEPAPAAARSTWSRRARVLIALGVLVVLVVALGLYLLLRAKPLHYFGSHETRQTMPTAAGHTVYLNTWLYATHRVHVDSIEPAFTVNSSRATVRILLCTPRDGAEGLGGGFLPDMKSAFRTWHDFRPGDYLIGSTGQAGVDVMVAITPTAKGQVAMAGFRIRYHVGDRQGSEQAGMDTTVRTVTG